MRLSPLDLVSLVMDRPERPLDVALVVHLRDVPVMSRLAQGAVSARRCYPVSGAVLDGDCWRTTLELPAIVRRSVERRDAADATAAYVDEAWDITRNAPVRQILVKFSDAAGGALVTRVHHAAGDAISACLWVCHQLEVALGFREPMGEAAAYSPPVLRDHPAPLRRNAFAFRSRADRLRHSGGRPSGARHWRTIPFPIGDLERAARAHGLSVNDLFAASALEAARLWNSRYRRRWSEPAIGLWMPMNIRETALEGFGNGTSRIRVYHRAVGEPFVARCRLVRQQVEWSRTNGEWALPSHSALTAMPPLMARPLLRTYLRRPCADMATLALSHMRRSPFDDSPVASHITGFDIVGPLARRHPLGLYGISMQDRAHLTFVHDPAQLDDHAVTAFVALFEEQMASGARELGEHTP